MGVYYTARAIVGFRFSTKKFFRNENQPSCEHNTTGARFCPTCGTRVGTSQQTIQLEEYDELMELLEDLPRGYVWEQDEYDDTIWVGAGISVERDTHADRDVPDPAEVLSTVSGALADVMHLINLGPCRLWVTNIGR